MVFAGSRGSLVEEAVATERLKAGRKVGYPCKLIGLSSNSFMRLP